MSNYSTSFFVRSFYHSGVLSYVGYFFGSVGSGSGSGSGSAFACAHSASNSNILLRGRSLTLSTWFVLVEQHRRRGGVVLGSISIIRSFSISKVGLNLSVGGSENNNSNNFIEKDTKASILNSSCRVSSSIDINISRQVKNTFKYKYFSYPSFTSDNFCTFIMTNLNINRVYSILIKLSFEGNSLFYMCGPQIGLNIKDFHDFTLYKNCYTDFITKIESVISDYNLSSNPDSIMIMYRVLRVDSELLSHPPVLRDIKNIALNKNVLQKTITTDLFSSKYLPLTSDHSHFGYLLEGSLRLNVINNLCNIIRNTKALLPDVLNNFNSNMKVFKNTYKDMEFLIIEEPLFKYSDVESFIQKSSIIKNELISKDLYISMDLNNKYFIRSVFNMSTGLCLFEALDIIKNKEMFSRKIRDTIFTIRDGKVSELKQILKLSSITSLYNKNKLIYKGMSNPNFGTFDIESYIDTDGVAKVYCLGFVTLLDKSSVKSYYITDYSDSLDSNYLIIRCIDDMLISKYHNYIFYVHNLGKFDVIFLYKTLSEFNLRKGFDYYKLSPLFRDDQILKLSISVKLQNKKYVKITFVDSLNLLNTSLSKLATDFEVSTLKGIFPYKFVSKDNFNYVGSVPAKEYYNNNISDVEYNAICANFVSTVTYPSTRHKPQTVTVPNVNVASPAPDPEPEADTNRDSDAVYTPSTSSSPNGSGSFVVGKNWDLKREVLNYLDTDLISLLEVLEKFNTSLFIDYNIQMTEGLTISRLALNLYLKHYLKNNQIPLINKFNLFNFIHYGYYGGITEVYIPYGKILKYYDVNSLYPFVALNPMPGLDCLYLESFDDRIGLNLDKLFGFFYARVKTNDQYLGLLPIKTTQGLIFPNGHFTGVWFSEELKFARDNGYEITVIKGYHFNKEENVFTEYVKDLYELKAKSTGFKKVINKSLLNNLIGRFGMNIFKPITKEVSTEKLDYLIGTRTIKSLKTVTDNKYLVTYLPTVSEEICVQHGLDYVKILDKENNENLEKNIDLFKDVSIAISAAVTSYARIFMNKVKLEILKKGGIIYYSDTDSIVTNLSLEGDPLNLDYMVGKEIGQFKLEYEIQEGYFLSNKTYCLSLTDNRTIIKAKGVLNHSLTLEKFKSMYLSSKNILATKSESIKNYQTGSVLIQDKEVLLNHDAYTKRKKLYGFDKNKRFVGFGVVEKELWINTKPLIYNNIEKRITLSQKP